MSLQLASLVLQPNEVPSEIGRYLITVLENIYFISVTGHELQTQTITRNDSEVTIVGGFHNEHKFREIERYFYKICH